MKISHELYQKLSEWRAGAESECPSSDVRTLGLCAYVGHPLKVELKGLFEDLTLRGFYRNSYYPFGGQARFADDVWGNVCHLNPHRIAFVRMVLTEYEDENQS